MKRFIVDGQYKYLLSRNNIDVSKVLKRAQLPENLFSHDQIKLTEKEYYKLMNAISEQAPTQQTLIDLATTDGIENFSAPILAAYSSENGIKFIKRLGSYKPLIGPVSYKITTEKDEITVALVSMNDLAIDSKFYIADEFVFLINMLSKATEQDIHPVKITSTFGSFDQAFVDKFEIEPVKESVNSITFKESDLKLPFLVDNKAMRSYLTPELNKRLSELDVDESFSAQIRSLLVDLLSAGESSADVAAQKLNISKRTLQRKLKEEHTTFQEQLNSVREMLAQSYLQSTDMSSDEIAYLLGYAEMNSFLRAFSIWTGMSVSEYRKNIK